MSFPTLWSSEEVVALRLPKRVGIHFHPLLHVRGGRLAPGRWGGGWGW